MKITFFDIYRNAEYKISKNTNSGMGTGNNYGTSYLAKIQNKLIKKAIHYPPQNCLYAMSILRVSGNDVNYSEKLIDNNSDLYIFTSSIVNFETELNSIKEFRQHTNVPFLVIGPFAEIQAEKYIESDISGKTKIIIGEPESFFYENKKNNLLQVIEKSEKKIYSKNFYNLDLFPYPAWDIVFKSSERSNMRFLGNKKSVTIEGLRGCPYSCSFYCCYPNIQGKKLRIRKPENIFNEMCYMQDNLNVYNFTFRDPVFSIDKKNVKLLFNLIIKNKRKFNLCIETQLKDIDENDLDLMFAAGVKLIYVGIESSEEEVLKSVNRKNLSNNNIYEKIIKIEKKGIFVKGNYILGLPGDNYESCLKTIEFAEKINCTFAQFTVFTPMPVTPAWKNYKNKLDFKKYEEFTMWDLVIKHPNLEKKQIEKLKNRAALYYIKPKYIFKNLLKVFARAIF